MLLVNTDSLIFGFSEFKKFGETTKPLLGNNENTAVGQGIFPVKPEDIFTEAYKRKTIFSAYDPGIHIEPVILEFRGNG